MSMEQLISHRLPKSSHARSPSKGRSPSRESKRKKSPPSHGSSPSSRSSPKPLPPRPPSHYGSSYSWDTAQGQAFMDKVAHRVHSANSVLDDNEARPSSKDAPYLALVQLFNQFQGMPIDEKKTLITVNVLGSTGPLRMLVTSDATVKEVIKMALLKYAHEGRVPSLGRSTKEFELYDSQFSSQALKPDDRVSNLGTRNFVLCALNLQSSCGGESQTSSNNSKSWWSYVTAIKSLV